MRTTIDLRAFVIADLQVWRHYQNFMVNYESGVSKWRISLDHHGPHRSATLAVGLIHNGQIPITNFLYCKKRFNTKCVIEDFIKQGSKSTPLSAILNVGYFFVSYGP